MRSPTRRAALAVGVAVLLVTAGCLGGTNPTDTGSSSTPETTECTYDAATNASNATETWSPNASADQYPPGVADNGTLVNASTLVDAHFDATANRPMELRIAYATRNRNSTTNYTLTHGQNQTPFYSTYNHTSGGERIKNEFYGTESGNFDRFTFDNETLYRVIQNSTVAVDAWTGYETQWGPQTQLFQLLYAADYTVNGTVEGSDRTFVQLTTDGDSVGTGYWNGTVLVTADGVVHDIDVTFGQTTGEDTEPPTDVSMTLDTDVEWCGPPSWVGSIPHLSLSLVEDGHAVEIRNTGGAALPANTSLNITGGEDPHYGTEGRPSRGDMKGTVTTDERLEPGDAVYVTAGANGSASSFALHDEPTRGEYSFGNAGLTGYHSLGDSEIRGQPGNVSYRLATGIEPWSEAE